MNEILQKRIEEAAKRYAWSHDTIGVDKETFHTESSQKHPIPIDKHVRIPIQHEMEVAFKCAAHFILNNQWISVDEELPVLVDKNSGKSEVVFAMVGYDNVFVVYYDYSNEHWYYNNYPGYDPQIYYEVTYWMPIPQI